MRAMHHISCRVIDHINNSCKRRFAADEVLTNLNLKQKEFLAYKLFIVGKKKDIYIYIENFLC